MIFGLPAGIVVAGVVVGVFFFGIGFFVWKTLRK